MPRKPSKEKDPVSVALIQMRGQRGWTQMQQAGDLKVALSTVARWEGWGPPKGEVLRRLTAYAKFNKLPAAAALQYELDKENSRTLPDWCQPRSGEEKNCIEAVVRVLRESEFAKDRGKLLRLLKPVFNAPPYEDPDLRRLKAEAESEGVPESPIERFLKAEQEEADRFLKAQKEESE